MSNSKGVMVITEWSEERLRDISLALIGEGRRIADELKQELNAVVIGDVGETALAPLGEHGVDKIYHLDNPALVDYSAELYTDAISSLIKDAEPAIVLCGSTAIGKDLCPRLAARLKTGLVSGCISLKLDEDGLLLQTKPTHGNKVHSTIVCSVGRPQIACCESMAFRVNDGGGYHRRAEILRITPDIHHERKRVRTTGIMTMDPMSIDLAEAEVIVAGGRGVGSAENFRLIEDLAETLGGCVAASRMAVDAGWVSSDKLVGLTGKSVAPRLYIACGISGALHHTLSMKDSGKIIAINNDGNAPIFRIADIGIVGDLKEVIPRIIEQTRQRKDSR
ncbi:electron transfer flavoprotein subunit alpha/FixB family protein [Chloroflexota bacterium]